MAQEQSSTPARFRTFDIDPSMTLTQGSNSQSYSGSAPNLTQSAIRKLHPLELEESRKHSSGYKDRNRNCLSRDRNLQRLSCCTPFHFRQSPSRQHHWYKQFRQSPRSAEKSSLTTTVHRNHVLSTRPLSFHQLCKLPSCKQN